MMHRAARVAASLTPAALGLLLLGGAPTAQAALVVRAPERYQFERPFSCDTGRYQYLLDEQADICGGVSTMQGPGWAASPRADAVLGVQHYISRLNNPNGTEKATWWPTIRVPGRYEVWVDWRASANRARRTPYYLYADDGNYLYWVNQYWPDHGFSGVRWARLGTHLFAPRKAVKGAAPRRGYVKVVNNPRDHSEGIDGVGFRYVGPAATSGLAATRDRNGSIALAWKPAFGATSYEVNRYDTSTGARVMFFTGSVSPSFLDTSVQTGVDYFYKVRAVGYKVGSALKRGPWSAVATGLQVLPAPTGLTATDSRLDGVALQWEVVSGAAGYEVYRGIVDDVSRASLAGTTDGAASTLDAGAVAGVTYLYWVRAFDSRGNRGLISARASGWRQLYAPALVATMGTYTDRVDLGWTLIAGAVAYEVFRNSVDDSAGAARIATVQGTTTASDTTVARGTGYYYWVRAVGASGHVSEFSNSAPGRTAP